MSKFVDSILGHAVGDAMGMPTEFCIREELLANPVTEMLGSDKTNQQAGSWTDDTSMEIAVIDSIINKKQWDYADIMQRWCDWLNKADYTPNCECFDVGRTCLKAIRNFARGINPVECGLNDINSNGNGSLMRILPVSLYSFYKRLSEDEMQILSDEVCSLTHRHDISKMGCYMYNRFIINLLSGMDKAKAYRFMQLDDYSKYSIEAINSYDRLLNNDISKYNIDEIKSTGYIVDTWECVLWILLNSKNYKECIIASTNIGNDTDTIGAIVGSMAGIIYGFNSIPENWVSKLVKKDYLIDLANDFEKTISTLNKDILMGAAIGDIVGSIYEINDCKTMKNFELFNKYDHFTDDTVMTFAVAKALLNFKNMESFEQIIIDNMVETGNKYLSCGYGPSFLKWLKTDHKPYGSFGNGAAMRIGAIPVVFDSIEEIKKVSSMVTNVSHNHPDSIVGAESICIAIHLALQNKNKKEIKTYIENNYFTLNDTIKDLQKSKRKIIINCLDTVKASLICFFESFNFEDAIRNAISIGGDSDTIASITGAIASAYYGIPSDIYNKGTSYLDDYLLKIHKDFSEYRK